MRCWFLDPGESSRYVRCSNVFVVIWTLYALEGSVGRCVRAFVSVDWWCFKWMR